MQNQCGSVSRVIGQSRSGSRNFITKNCEIVHWKKILYLQTKNCNIQYFYLGLYEGLKPTGEDQNPLKENIQHFKSAHFLDFFCGRF